MTDIDKMVQENMNLVYFAINKYYQQYRGDEDIVQIGRIALWQACLKWTPDKCEFSSYAVSAIRRAVQHEWVRRTALKRTADATACSLEAPVGPNVDEDLNYYRVIPSVDDVDYLDLDPILMVLDAKRERVLRLLMAGYKANEIAEMTGCSETRVNQFRKDIAKAIRGDMSERQRKQAIRRRIKEQEAAGQSRPEQGDAGPQSQLVIRLLNSGAAQRVKRPGDDVPDAPRRPRGRPRKMA